MFIDTDSMAPSYPHFSLQALYAQCSGSTSSSSSVSAYGEIENKKQATENRLSSVRDFPCPENRDVKEDITLNIFSLISMRGASLHLLWIRSLVISASYASLAFPPHPLHPITVFSAPQVPLGLIALNIGEHFALPWKEPS